MPEIIFDNCVLSNFALSNSLNLIKRLYPSHSYITDFVAAENLKGIIKGYRELSKIKEAIRDGWIKEITLEAAEEKSIFEALSVSLGFGEASSIAVAKVRGFVFACDDKAARKEASLLNVRLTGTVGILIKAVRKRIIDYKKANEILNSMISRGFYSPIKSIGSDFHIR
jgi:predicted nucleic acid-binding protein